MCRYHYRNVVVFIVVHLFFFIAIAYVWYDRAPWEITQGISRLLHIFQNFLFSVRIILNLDIKNIYNEQISQKSKNYNWNGTKMLLNE